MVGALVVKMFEEVGCEPKSGRRLCLESARAGLVAQRCEGTVLESVSPQRKSFWR